MNKAVFLDRDGTINIDYGYVYEIKKFKYLPNAIKGLKILNDLGYLLIIVTNQSGIGRGYYTIADFNKLNDYMLNDLKEKGVNIAKVYMCPHTDNDKCSCRKPEVSLFYQAIKEFDIDLSKSYLIGDKERDLSLCEKENIKGILLTTEKSKKYICKKNLYEAANYIKNEGVQT